MTGFRKFLLQGNLVDIAVAFIMATAFGKVVTTFVSWLTAQMPDSTSEIFSDVPNSFGAFLNATIAFVILAAVVYFLIVMPYTKAKERFFPDQPEAEAPEVVLLTQIRDSLAVR
ncbi:MAG TPA: MscL family protein [Nocardioides sp.]|nr:MscL family protein [Nocardioides sp.]